MGRCIHCGRPGDLCWCASVVPVRCRTGITVVQHPKERHHPFNTARLAAAILPGLRLQIAWDGRIAPLPLPSGAALLYPAPGARELGVVRPSHLVLLDGTWSQARSLHRHHPWLRELPTVVLPETAPSSYRIRKEPAPHCLSTLEALARALAILEPGSEAPAALERAFGALVEGQIAHLRRRSRRPRRVGRRESLRQRLARRWENVVLFYLEFTRHPSQVLQVAAFRPATGAVFDSLVDADRLPSDRVLRHMGLTREELRNAPPLERVMVAWRAFIEPDDLFVTWGGGSGLLAERLGVRPAVQLRSMYGNLRRGTIGRPDQIVDREGLDWAPVPVRGRAASRLGRAAAIAAFLRDDGSDRRDDQRARGRKR